MSHFRALNAPTPLLFFTGKGGVGKTSLACATAIGLADRGLTRTSCQHRSASNLDEMLEVALTDRPTPVPNVAGLSAMNIDPEAPPRAIEPVYSKNSGLQLPPTRERRCASSSLALAPPK